MKADNNKQHASVAVYFAHGQESGPWGSKIQYLADIARQRDLAVFSPDYSHSLLGGPRERQLRSLLAEEEREVILVGSSMGAWVSCRAAHHHPCLGLFLMAAAFQMPEHPAATLPEKTPAYLVHGWHDEVVPVEQSLAAARSGSARLLLVPDQHRLANSASDIQTLFAGFLDHCLAEKN